MASSFVTFALSLAAAVSSTPLSTSPFYTPAQRSPLAPAPLSREFGYAPINNSYMVMLKQDTPAAVMQNHFNFLQAAHETHPLVDDNFRIGHVYKHTKGYSGTFSEGAVEQLRQMPEVDYIEQDQIVRIQDTQKSAPWGLARVSHRDKLTFGTFTRYEYDPAGGEGVDVYVIDTGINTAHVEFQGRASWGKTIPLNDVDEDGNGHGTHCAGTIASAKYGVAKAANVIAVKVLGSNGSGSMSDVVEGVNFATESALTKAQAAKAEEAATGKASTHKGSVANMSLGGGKSRALDQAVNAAVDAGLHFAVAAGNDNRDACNYSPAAAEKAVTVGASTLGDERAYFSNFGECVDVFAPGLNILSTYIGSTTAVATLSGTSMASPHTAGMLAYLLSLYPSKTFNPEIAQEQPAAMQLQRPFALALSSPTYMFVHAALPRWAASFLPVPRVAEEVTAPVPVPPTITPAQLKKALLDLASADKLSELPPKTVNLLIFNNATA
ncbi:peptidase S8/S53 domain-containing protein [Mycena maculata]|uniref:Peptidase S8/S53 domain-containing protein n=1 Tax=Mycena maculata TaxID=230809 RepID=A0AAD7ITH5_9AGAR|nr:peptidase S8/S53 domain-containing protein [Mycena maculata]